MTPLPRPARSEYGAHWTLGAELTYLNHGSFGACPRVVLEEQSRLRALLEADPMAFFFDIGPALWQQARLSLANFLRADVDGLSFLPNASTGVSTVLRSLRFKPGDEILVPDHAYQACRNAVDHVCTRSGARTVVVTLPFPPEDEEQIVELVLAAVTDRTRLALLDTVTSPTALLLPFERLTRELQARGVDVLLDAAHGAGLVELDLRRLEAAYVTGNCHKWLCTPKGSAFLHVRADRRSLIEPLITSHGYSAPGSQAERTRLEFDWQGTQDTTPWLCIPQAIAQLAGFVPGGWPAIMARNQALAVTARNILADALGVRQRVPDTMLAAMATLPIPVDRDAKFTTALAGDPLMRRLYSEFGIQAIVFAWPQHEARYLRVSAALYNSAAEYEYLAASLGRLGVRSDGTSR
jgi:isopenicillin-N epimerase